MLCLQYTYLTCSNIAECYMGFDYTMALYIFPEGLVRGRKFYSGAICPRFLKYLYIFNKKLIVLLIMLLIFTGTSIIVECSVWVWYS